VLPLAALVQPAVIFASFLDGAFLRELMGQYHRTTLEIYAILQVYFRPLQVGRHVFL
jgi:hypothetical protein